MKFKSLQFHFIHILLNFVLKHLITQNLMRFINEVQDQNQFLQ